MLYEGTVVDNERSASLDSELELVAVRVADPPERPASLFLMLLQQRSDLSHSLRLWTGVKLYLRYLATMLKSAARALY